MPRVAGVDARKGGWVSIVLAGTDVMPYAASRLDDLVTVIEADGALDVVAIDMPIGLPDTARRAADDQARAYVGPRRSSVFVTPVRAAIEAHDYARANEIQRDRTGQGLSRQAFALKEKLLEVDAWVKANRQRRRVVEIHPEVCFAELAGEPLTVRKSSWAGAERRRCLLAEAGVRLEGELGTAGALAGVDDILDAAAAAWTARRVGNDAARSLPARPEVFSDGLPSAIWV